MGRHEVVGAMICSDQRVLLCHRSPDRDWYPGAWDLPGGHVETSETAPEALSRELDEELGIHVRPPAGPPVARIEASELELLVWAIDGWGGEIENRSPAEHDVLGWFDAAGLIDLDLLHPAYLPMLLDALRDRPGTGDPADSSNGAANTSDSSVLGRERVWTQFVRKAGLGQRPEFRDAVEAVRHIPYGRPTERTAEGVIAEWRGTCSAKHELLALLAARPEWAYLDARINHRVYELTPTVARRLFSEAAAAIVPSDGVTDVHTYMTVAVEGRRVVIDATVPGAPWDGRSDMILACGEGIDVDGGDDPRGTKARLVEQHCDAVARDRVIEALGRLR